MFLPLIEELSEFYLYSEQKVKIRLLCEIWAQILILDQDHMVEFVCFQFSIVVSLSQLSECEQVGACVCVCVAV